MPLKSAVKKPERVSRVYDPSEENMSDGGFLDGKHAEIIDATYHLHTFEAKGEEGKPGYSPEQTITNAKLTFQIEGLDKPVERDYSCGAACEPSEDGFDGAEEGPLVIAREAAQFKGFNKKGGFGRFLIEGNRVYDGFSALVAQSNGGIVGLIGTTGVLKEIPGNEYKDKVTKQKKQGREMAVFESIEQAGPGEQAQAPKPGPKRMPKPSEKYPKADAPDEPEPEPEQDDSGEAVEDAVAEAIVTVVAKGPQSKLKLSQAVGLIFKADPAARKEATRQALQDDYLKQGAENGWWQYDGKNVSAA